MGNFCESTRGFRWLVLPNPTNPHTLPSVHFLHVSISLSRPPSPLHSLPPYISPFLPLPTPLTPISLYLSLSFPAPTAPPLPFLPPLSSPSSNHQPPVPMATPALPIAASSRVPTPSLARPATLALHAPVMPPSASTCPSPAPARTTPCPRLPPPSRGCTTSCRTAPRVWGWLTTVRPSRQRSRRHASTAATATRGPLCCSLPGGSSCWHRRSHSQGRAGQRE